MQAWFVTEREREIESMFKSQLVPNWDQLGFELQHVTKSPRPSPSIIAYCKRSNTGGGNGLVTRLQMCCVPKAKAAMSFWLTVAWR